MQGCAPSKQVHYGLPAKQHHTTDILGAPSRWRDPAQVVLYSYLNTKIQVAKDHSQHLRASRMTSDSQISRSAMISQPPTSLAAGERPSLHKITVASLCCDADEANSAFTASTEDHQSYGLKASSTLHAAPTRAKRHQFECPGLAVTLPLPLSAHSQYSNVFELAAQDSPFICLDTTKIFSGASDVTDSTSGSVSHSNSGVHPATQTAHAESPPRVLRPARPSFTN